jgi:amino-acid N-acetyltransferase
MALVVRAAKTSDVKKIRKIVDAYTDERRLLFKATVTLFEAVQEFVVAELDGEVVGCGALHVLWEDLAEVRTVAVLEEMHGKGIGNQIMIKILENAKDIGVKKVFCLTFETKFFGSHGFKEIEGTPVSPEVYQEMIRSYDAGVAEFLDLESAKPNTLGNTRMLKIL